MVQRCVECGFAAETTVSLPEGWVAYLGRDSGVAGPEGELTVPVCLGCQRTIESLLDPRQPRGGEDPDGAVRAFLDECGVPEE